MVLTTSGGVRLSSDADLGNGKFNVLHVPPLKRIRKPKMSMKNSSEI